MDKAPTGNNTAAIYEQPLGDERKYLRALAHRFPGTIQFETGCGHIIHDLLARMPSIPQMEEQKNTLCHRIVEAVHPLAACLFAQSVYMTITMTGDPLPPPEVIAGLATYTVFDIENDVMRHCFLSAPDGVASLPALAISSGLAVMCEPLGYGVHVVNTGAGGVSHNKTGAIWEWTDRVVHAWYEQRANKPFMPVRLQIRTSLLTEGQILGVTDAAAMATLASTTGVPNTAIPAAAETHRITPSFMHEAGFAETASQPRSGLSQQRTPRSTPTQSANELPVDARTGRPLPAGVAPSTVLPYDQRTGRLMPVGILDQNAALPLDPQTGKLLPVGVTNPLLAVPTDPRTGKPLPAGVADPNAVVKPDAAPKDAHDHLRHPHGPDVKPDVS